MKNTYLAIKQGDDIQDRAYFLKFDLESVCNFPSLTLKLFVLNSHKLRNVSHILTWAFYYCWQERLAQRGSTGVGSRAFERHHNISDRKKSHRYTTHARDTTVM
jgi:hypothetical protein